MKMIKKFVAVVAISMMSFATFAQSISVTASTLDSAEAKVAAKASEQGTGYTITSAIVNDKVHMTARLDK